MWPKPTLNCLLLAGLWWSQPQQAETAQFNAPAQNPDDRTTIDAVFSPPSLETIPPGRRGEQIRMGYEIVVQRQQYAKRYVGNKLSCTNCHLDAGLNPNAAPFVGLSVLYPEYRVRVDRQMSLADRINECFERSLNGKALPPESSKLRSAVLHRVALPECAAGQPSRLARDPEHQSTSGTGSSGGKDCFRENMFVLPRNEWTGNHGCSAAVGTEFL
jgi:cytochrome c